MHVPMISWKQLEQYHSNFVAFTTFISGESFGYYPVWGQYGIVEDKIEQ